MRKPLYVLAILMFFVAIAGCDAVAPEAAPAPAEIKVSSALVNNLDSICEITHAANDNNEFYGVYGNTQLPRGTVFTFTLEVDGTTQTVPMIATAGSIHINGKLYGHQDGYIDDGTNTNFGFTSADMPKVALPHGPVSAQVTLNGQTICSL